jgi:hypothetical protein
MLRQIGRYAPGLGTFLRYQPSWLGSAMARHRIRGQQEYFEMSLNCLPGCICYRLLMP